jgi:hypothetical protein
MVIEHTIDGRLEGLSVGEAAHGQIFILDVAPERLDGVQFGRVGRQVEDGDARSRQGREQLQSYMVRRWRLLDASQKIMQHVGVPLTA